MENDYLSLKRHIAQSNESSDIFFEKHEKNVSPVKTRRLSLNLYKDKRFIGAKKN